MKLRGHDPVIAQLDQAKRPLTTVALLFISIVCLSLIGLQVWSSYVARDVQLRKTTEASATMARALADHADYTLDLADTILAGVVERIRHDGASAYGERLQRHMMDAVRRTPAMQGLFIYDDKGRWVLNSLPGPVPQASNADREYFKYHSANPDRGVHIGVPLRSRSSGVWILPVSRRLDNADGSFAGVALATIKLDYLQAFQQSFDIGARGSIVLAMQSGELVMSFPYKEAALGGSTARLPDATLWRQSAPAGSAILRDGDGKRLYSYRRLRGYPLVVSLSQSRDEILQNWWASAYVSTAGVLVLVLILMWMGTRLLRQLRIRDRLEEELRNAQLALKTKNKSLKRLALNDSLTRLANRRHFDGRLDAEFKRAVREGTSVALVMLDVDFFKKYNDHYGHPKGDVCLQLVARCLRQGRRRPGDFVARVGGEEFAILLPNTDLAGALALADTVRREVAYEALEHEQNPARVVTISCGVHAIWPGLDDTPDALIQMADRALYLAKAQGRNCVCSNDTVAPPRPPRLTVVTKQRPS